MSGLHQVGSVEYAAKSVNLSTEAYSWRLRSFTAAIFIIAALLYAYFIAFQSLAYLIRNDDAFYYFEVAKNFAYQDHFTLDGLRDTNGVQPLWAMILAFSARIFIRLGIEDPLLLTRLFIMFSAIFNLGAGYYVFQLARRWLRLRDSYLFLCLWLFTPGMVTTKL